jgi:hypothetical protein
MQILRFVEIRLVSPTSQPMHHLIVFLSHAPSSTGVCCTRVGAALRHDTEYTLRPIDPINMIEKSKGRFEQVSLRHGLIGAFRRSLYGHEQVLTRDSFAEWKISFVASPIP